MCLQKVLETSVSTVIADEPVAIPILRRFSGVYIQDSSTITLPDTLAMIWAGCGGSTEKNTSSALKAQIQLDLNTGKLSGPYLQPGREHDQSSKQKEMSLPEGSLRITDLGYFSLSYFNSLSAQGVYWLSRVKSQCGVYDSNGKQWDLVHLLDEHCRDRMDIQVFLGVKERVECRLIAFRVSDEVARIRRCRIIKEAKKDGKKPSNRLPTCNQAGH